MFVHMCSNSSQGKKARATKFFVGDLGVYEVIIIYFVSVFGTIKTMADLERFWIETSPLVRKSSHAMLRKNLS